MDKSELIGILLGEDRLTDILGQEQVKDQIRSALIMKRNILIIGPPGIGKTTLAKNIAGLLPEIEVNDCEYNCDPKRPLCPKCASGATKKTKKISGKERFIRLQGSPDLTVEDMLGDIDPIKAMKFGPQSIEAFTPGKVFKANQGILFFDELNRCPQKLQNALLQVLEEGTATLGSYDIDLPAEFIFIATMNPEDETTEKISDVLLDRFDVIYMGYPETKDVEKKIVKTKSKKLDVTFPEDLLDLTIGFVRHLRRSDKLSKLPSVRASMGLYERAQSNALIARRKEVIFEDISGAVLSVISHRIELKPSIKYLQSPADLVAEEFRSFSHREGFEPKEKGDYP